MSFRWFILPALLAAPALAGVLPVTDGLVIHLDAEHAARNVAKKGARRDIVIADFEGADYAGWKVEGTAFGASPFTAAQLAPYQKITNFAGRGFVNSHQSRDAANADAGDAHTGRLTSPPFEVSRRYLHFLLGGGNHPGKTGVNLLFNGKVFKSVTGSNTNDLVPQVVDLGNRQGRAVQLQLIDELGGTWGNTSADHFLLSDQSLVDHQGPAVEKWIDLSGRDNHATMYGQLLAPAVKRDAINGKPALRFAGQHGLATPPNKLNGDYTVLALVRVYDKSQVGRSISTLGVNWLLGHHEGKQHRMYMHNNLWIDTNGQALDTRPHLYVGSGSAKLVTFAADGVPVRNRGNLPLVAPGNISLGGLCKNGEGPFSKVDIAEVIVFDRMLEARELQLMHGYFNSKYALGLPNAIAYTAGFKLVRQGGEDFTIGPFPFREGAPVRLAGSDFLIRNIKRDSDPPTFELHSRRGGKRYGLFKYEAGETVTFGRMRFVIAY